MARTYWNVVLAMVAALGMGGGMSWFLFAQAPDAPERFVTIDVSNEKVRCKILRSWSLPDGARAYQVKSVDAGDMLTVVRQAATAGEKDAFVRVYKWRDAATSPVGAPVPPNNGTTSQNVASTTTEAGKAAKSKAAPTAIAKDTKKSVPSSASVAAKGTTKITAYEPTKRSDGSKEARDLSPSRARNAAKETIITVPDQPGAESGAADGLAKATPRKESGFDNSVDQLGQAPWAKEETAADLPGKSTLESGPDRKVVQASSSEASADVPAKPNLEPMFALPSALKAETKPALPEAPKLEPKRMTPPKHEAPAAPKSISATVPPPLPLPTLPAVLELAPPRTFPALAESTIVPPPLPPTLPPSLPATLPPPLPPLEAKATLPSSLAPPPLPTVPEIPLSQPAKSELAASKAWVLPAPQATDHSSVMVPPYESVRRSIADRILSATAPRHSAPALPEPSPAANVPPSVPKDVTAKPADVPATGEDRPQTTIVLGPTVIVQSHGTKNVVQETVPVVDREQGSFADTALVVSKSTNFDIRQMPTAAAIPAAPAEPIAPPLQAPTAAAWPNPPAMVVPAPPMMLPPPLAAAPIMPAPIVPKETELHPASHEIASAVPAPVAANPTDIATSRPVPATDASIPEMSPPKLTREGGFNRSRTTIAADQVIVIPPILPAKSVQPTHVDANDRPITIAESTPAVTKTMPAPARPNSILGMLGGTRGVGPATPQRTLTGSLFGRGNTAAVNEAPMVSPEANYPRDTIVQVSEGPSPYADPVIKKITAANPPRATSIVGMMTRAREERAAAQALSTPAPDHGSQYAVAAHGERNRFTFGSGSTTTARPAASAGYPGETIVEVADSGYNGTNAAPVVERKPAAQINRSTTIVGLMGVNPTAIPHSTYAYASPYANYGAAAAGFDRTRTTISADQVAANRPAVRPSPVAEPIVVVSEAPPVVQQKKASLFGRSPALAAVTVEHQQMAGGPSLPDGPPFNAPQGNTLSMATSVVTVVGSTPRPPQTPSADATSKLLPAGYNAPLPPPVNPIQQTSHNMTYAKSEMPVPANAAMDRPRTAALQNSGDQAALAKLMQTAKDAAQPSQRELAVIALSSYDGRKLPQIVSFLNHLAINDPAPAVRAAVVNALARMNVAPETVVHTLETLREDGDIRVRQAVAEATRAYGLANR